MTNILLVLQTALGIGMLIFVHELGHYLAARLAGVRVEVFSLGFGPRLFGFQRGPTDYRISLVPVGGYVVVAGDGPPDPRLLDGLPDDSLVSKSFGNRALFYSGGVLMNLAFALIAFPIAFHSGVPFDAPVVGSVAPGGAAWQAGIEPGDRIVSLGTKEIHGMGALRLETALTGGGEPVPIVIERDGTRRELTVQPIYSEGMGVYDLGVIGSIAPVPLRITAVDQDTPAATAGLLPDDRLLGIDGRLLVGAGADEALAEIADDEPREIALLVERDGETAPRTIRFTPQMRPDPRPRLGVLPAADLVGAIRPTAVSDELDLRVGDRILTLDGERFDPTRDEPFAGPTDRLTMTVERGSSRVELQAAGAAAARSQLAENLALRSEPDTLRIMPLADTPARNAGLLCGDRVLTIGDRELSSWDQLVEAVRAAVHGEQVEPLRLAVDRDGERLELVLTPAAPDYLDLGFSYELQPLREDFQVDSLGGALRAGMVASVDLIKRMYVTLKRMFTGDVSSRGLSGIITISRASYAEAQSGWIRFLYFLGLLSINLAFVNLLPIPVLDGGHLMFLLIEKIKGSPVSAEVVNYSQIVGLVFVLALMLWVTYNDILKL